MNLNLAILGLIFNIVGVFILTITAIINPFHSRREDLKWWNKKRYWWNGWRPIFKVRPPNKKSKWVIKPKHKVVRYGFIPPSHQWNIIGFLLILVGFILQLWFYLS